MEYIYVERKLQVLVTPSAGRRRVPPPQVVVTSLLAHLDRFEPSSFVFRAPEGGPVRLASWRSRFFLPASKAAGGNPFRVHDYADIRVMPIFRKSCCSQPCEGSIPALTWTFE